MSTLTKIGFKGMVNAAFLQEVKESNTQLWALLREVRQLTSCKDERRGVANCFTDKLARLRDELATAFSLEETYGFIGGIAPSARMCSDALHARNQHRELYLRLHDICEQVEESQYRGTIVRDLEFYLAEFEAFDQSLKAHEEFEADLIRNTLGADAF